MAVGVGLRFVLLFSQIQKLVELIVSSSLISETALLESFLGRKLG